MSPKRMTNKELTVSSRVLSELQKSPLPSSILYQRLRAVGVQANQARTTVSRLIGKSIRQYKLILGKGNRILTLGQPNPDADLLKTLYDSEFFGRPALKSFVYCLATSHPVVTPFDVAKLAVLRVGAPPDSWEETNPLIEAFEQLGVLSADSPTASMWAVNRKILADAGIPYGGNLTLNWKYHSIRDLVRLKLNKALTDWMRNNTFLSDKGSKISSEDKRVVSLYRTPFDVVGFCFTRGVARRSKSALEDPLQASEASYPDVQGRVFPSPMIGDCLLEECNLEYARSFYRRVWEASSVKGKRAPIPFVFAKYFERDAFKFLKGQGVLIWTHAQLLGSKTADAIERILSISENLVSQQNLNPQLFIEIFEGFESFQGVFGQLKGKLFELLMAYFFQRRFSDTRLGWQIEGSTGDDIKSVELDTNADSSQRFDVDIVAFQDNDAIVVECKGIKKDGFVAEGDVDRHFTHRLPLVRTLLLRETSRPVSRFKAIVITTGKFDETVTTKVYKPRPDTTFELWNRERLLAELRSANQIELISIVEKYY